MIDINLIRETPELVKANIKGWKAQQFKNIRAIQTRKTSSAQGLWKGYVSLGKANYYLGLHPISAIGKTVMLSLKYPHYTGLAYCTGYLTSSLRHTEHISDKEIILYFRKSKLKQHLFKIIKRSKE